MSEEASVAPSNVIMAVVVYAPGFYRATATGVSRSVLSDSLGPHELQPTSSVHEILQARILEWVVTPFSRGVFLTQGSNPGLLHCRQILYH